MKCPKCLYIGFETGDRCKNCGYEFSLLPIAQDPGQAPVSEPRVSVDPLDLSLRQAQPQEPEAAPVLPLFREEEIEDEPLVRVTAPRPPIAVRKTPDVQRIRLAPTQPAESLLRDAVFEFGTEPAPEPEGDVALSESESRPPDAPRVETASTPVAPRLIAALIDHALLLTIDAIVVYFTLRLTALTLAEWRVIPAAPLLAFLFGLKLAYLSTFTLAGGQTIGKMATGIKVVADDDRALAPWQSLRRAIVGVASIVTLGIPFLLALTDPARRGLHDRIAHTRVVALS